MIKKVGSIPNILRKSYEKFKKENRSVGHYEENNEIKDKLDNYFYKKAISLGFQNKYRLQKSSWFNETIDPNINMTMWHLEGGSGYIEMLIASYPHPTQIYLSNDFKEHYVYGQPMKVKQEHLIFTPKVGDVYYLPKEILHRTNIKSIGKPHLVGRVWLYDKSD